MTEQEALMVALVTEQCDGGCTTCISHLDEVLPHVLPDIDWAALRRRVRAMSESEQMKALGYERWISEQGIDLGWREKA